MERVKARKITRVRKKGGRTAPLGEEALRKAKKRFEENNPMRNPQTVKKKMNTQRKKGNMKNLFEKNNLYGGERKSEFKKHTQRAKDKISMQNFGHPPYEKQQQVTRERYLKNNPMHNPETVRKKLNTQMERKMEREVAA